MSNTASNWSQLEKMIMVKVNDALNKEVAESTKESVQTAVSEKIYMSGQPLYYERRGGNNYGGMGNSLGTGSLGDPNEMNHTVSGGTLEVTDVAKSKKPWDRDLSEAIISGYGSKSEWFNEPRDFLEVSRENMKNDKSHVESLANGLRRQGLTVIE